MSSLRQEILEWVEGGQLKSNDVPRALEIAGITPQLSEWRKFLDHLLLWVGLILSAAGVIFFFAYNWQSLHRFGKFALAQAMFLAALIVAWRFGTGQLAGKAALLATSLLTGALIALVGQTYQTGADTYELFAIWAALILPWAVIARFAPLWLLWVGLINLSGALYFDSARWGLFGTLFGLRMMLWTLLAINGIALCIWELGLKRGAAWLSRTGARIIAVAAGSVATFIGMLSILDTGRMGGWAILVYFVWMLALFLYYRNQVFDVFMLAGALLSAIVITVTLFVKFNGGSTAGFLLIALLVLGMSAAGAWWIRQLVLEKAA